MQTKLLKFSKLNTIYLANQKNSLNQANEPNIALIQLANMNQEYDVTSVDSISFDNENIIYYTEQEIINSEIRPNFMKLVIKNVLPNSPVSTDLAKSFINNVQSLLNQSITFKNLPFCIYSGSETFVFIRPGKTRKDLEYDLNRIGIVKDTTLLENGIKITVHRSNDNTNAEIVIQGNYSIIIIKYGADLKNEHLKYMKSIKEKSEQLLWTKERQNVLELSEFSLNWNKTEIDALSSLGAISNVSFKFIKDIHVEPLVLCDPNNLKFFKDQNLKTT